MRRLGIWFTLGVSLIVSPGVSQAARKAPKVARGSTPTVPAASTAAPALSATQLAKAAQDLLSEDEEVVRGVIRFLRDSRAPNAGEPLTELLALGTPPWLAADALTALAQIRDPKALQALVLYAGNRSPKTRLAAIRALAALPDGRVVTTLIERLGDADAEVRAAAAELLAARKDVREGHLPGARDLAVKRLLALLARNDSGAGAPLGLLMAPEQAATVAELRGRTDDAALAPCFGELIKRADVPDRLRLDVVRTLGGLVGAEATTALVEYVAAVPVGETRPSKEEAQAILDKRSATQ